MNSPNQAGLPAAASRVFEALADPAWSYRSIPGIARSTGLAEDEIRDILGRYAAMIRQAPFPDAKGRELFTLDSRPISLGERLAVTQALVSKSLRPPSVAELKASESHR